MAFHEISFPLNIALGASGGPERKTDVVTLASGGEVRNALWADSRRRYNAGYGLRSLDDIAEVTAFFEGRRGRLNGFRWRDRADWTSGSPLEDPDSGDQLLAVGDGGTRRFLLTKTYGDGEHRWSRRIVKPVAESVTVSVGGQEAAAAAFDVDVTAGIITFSDGSIPRDGQEVRAGFKFDVPARFDTDFLDINLAAFGAGEIPSIPIIELRLESLLQ